jgi:EmrB/QacA subfamily drug resistance transporter
VGGGDELSAAPAAAPADPALATRRTFTLIATIVGSSMTFVDGTVVNIALPTIGRELDAGLAAQQWIMLSYSLAVASLYVVAGALGDRYGRRPLFTWGVGGFAAASALCGLAPSAPLLIAGRVLQGVFGALLTTNSLALLRATFEADSGRAVGLWTAWTGIGALIGPPIGGLLVEYASWRWIFFLNLPGAVLTVALALLGRTREPPTESPRPINVPASAAVTVMFGALTFALIEGPRAGWGAVAWAFVVSPLALAAFVWNERHAANPLLPVSLLRERVFVVANVCTFVVYATLGASTFYLALYLQSAAVGYTPVRASFVFIPISIIMFFLAARFGRLADRDGPRRYLTLGPIVMGAGMALFLLATSTNLAQIVPGMVVFALGLSITVAPITSTALKAAPARYSGLAAGVNTTVSRMGGLIATPLLGVIISAVFAAHAGAGQGDPFATTGLGPDGEAAAVAAFRVATLVAAALCAGGGLIAWAFLPRGRLD